MLFSILPPLCFPNIALSEDSNTTPHGSSIFWWFLLFPAVILFFFAGIYLGSAFADATPNVAKPESDSRNPGLRQMGLPNTFNVLQKWEEGIASEISDLADPLKNILNLQSTTNVKSNPNIIKQSNLRGNVVKTETDSTNTDLSHRHGTSGTDAVQPIPDAVILPKAVSRTESIGTDVANHPIGK